MDKIAALRTFVTVAEEGGFSRAASELGLSKSAASRQISGLESALGGALFARSTRTVRLTEAGEAYLARARLILADLADADKEVAAPQDALRGILRVHAEIGLGNLHIAPAAADLMAQNPDLCVELDLNDRRIDPIEGDCDVTFRIVDNPSLGEKVALIELGLFAGSAYLAGQGRPQAPADVENHRGLVLGRIHAFSGWALRGTDRAIMPRLRYASNDVEAVREAAAAGLGIALLPQFAAGGLVRLLDGFEPKPLTLIAISGRRPMAKAGIRKLIERVRISLRKGA